MSRTSGRRSQRGSGAARTRARSSAGRPTWTSTSTPVGASSLWISTRGRRPTTQASRTRTRSCSSRPGARRRQLSGDAGDVIYYRTLDDYHRLRELAGDGVRVAVIGGGFIGSEIAAALATNGCDVTIVFPEPGIGARLFPAELSAFVNDYYREKGVTVLPDESVETISSGTVTTSERERRRG